MGEMEGEGADILERQLLGASCPEVMCGQSGWWKRPMFRGPQVGRLAVLIKTSHFIDKERLKRSSVFV